MKIVCAWCKKIMGEKPPLKDETITHSICHACKDRYFPKGGKHAYIRHDTKSHTSGQRPTST